MYDRIEVFGCCWDMYDRTEVFRCWWDMYDVIEVFGCWWDMYDCELQDRHEPGVLLLVGHV